MRTLLLTASALLASAAAAQTVLPPFSSTYTAVDLGQMPGVTGYGGIAFAPNDPHTLLVSAYGSGQIRAVPVLRDAQGRIQGFGPSTLRATVGGNDGGLAVGPNDTLFFTWYGPNRLGQVLPGSSTANRVIDLDPLGVSSSVGTCAFVPAGRPGAGRFKVAAYATSHWYDVTLTAAGDGTSLIAQLGPAVQIEGGPEGILYPPNNKPYLNGHVLIAEWDAGIAAYATDANGDPIPASRQLVATGFSANGGGAYDPIGGDLLFSWSDGHLGALRDGATCGAFSGYGQATPGAAGTPTLSASGCARLGQNIAVTANGPANAFGLFAVGWYATDIWFDGLHVLNTLDVTLAHHTGSTGVFYLPIAIPAQPTFGNTHLYCQTGYLDATTPSGFTASAGLDIWIR